MKKELFLGLILGSTLLTSFAAAPENPAFEASTLFTMNQDEFHLDLDFKFSHAIDPKQFSQYITDAKVGRHLSDHVDTISRQNVVVNGNETTYLLRAVGKTTILFQDFKKTLYSHCSETLTDQLWTLTCIPLVKMGDTAALIRSGKTIATCDKIAGEFRHCHVNLTMKPQSIDYVIFTRTVRQMSLAAGVEATLKYFGIALLLEKPDTSLRNLLSDVEKTSVGELAEALDRDWKNEKKGHLPKGFYEVRVDGLKNNFIRNTSCDEVE